MRMRPAKCKSKEINETCCFSVLWHVHACELYWQGITSHFRNRGQERLLIVATFWCLSLFQRMAKLWPEGPFMKVGRLTLIAILRIKCNLNCNGISSRILMGCLSHLVFSLPSYTLDPFLQMLATLKWFLVSSWFSSAVSPPVSYCDAH